MNNGITVIGEQLTLSTQKTVVVKNPQIVNGCQTVHCLYAAYKKGNFNLPRHLKVFVKLIKTESSETSSEIISATNSQNPVKSISLKANESIQRNIENYLAKHDIFYERRQNYYKSQGRTGLKVISLERLTQIMHSIINQEPIAAINDTATIIDSENKYAKLFHERVDYDIYRFGCTLYLKTWSLKNSDIRSGDLTEKDIISKGGYLLLTILSSLILSNAYFTSNNEKVKKAYTDTIDISQPPRNNVFSCRKESAFSIIRNDTSFETHYNTAKNILFDAVNQYKTNTGRLDQTLFKARTFDKDFLVPAIKRHIK